MESESFGTRYVRSFRQTSLGCALLLAAVVVGSLIFGVVIAISSDDQGATIKSPGWASFGRLLLLLGLAAVGTGLIRVNSGWPAWIQRRLHGGLIAAAGFTLVVAGSGIALFLS